MTPGVAPPYLAAAACPNSWKPADSDGDREDQDQQPGTFEGVIRRRGQPFAEEHPPADDREGGEQRE